MPALCWSPCQGLEYSDGKNRHDWYAYGTWRPLPPRLGSPVLGVLPALVQWLQRAIGKPQSGGSGISNRFMLKVQKSPA